MEKGEGRAEAGERQDGEGEAQGEDSEEVRPLAHRKAPSEPSPKEVEQHWQDPHLPPRPPWISRASCIWNGVVLTLFAFLVPASLSSELDRLPPFAVPTL